MLISLLGVLGLPSERPAAGGSGADDYIALLVELRNQARADKNYAMSDVIRDKLAALGVQLNDKGGETTWTVS
jgi:cysteinyl-tRNA synthetase